MDSLLGKLEKHLAKLDSRGDYSGQARVLNLLQLSLDPGCVGAMARLGRIAMGQRNYLEAVLWYAVALAHTPNNALVVSDLLAATKELKKNPEGAAGEAAIPEMAGQPAWSVIDVLTGQGRSRMAEFLVLSAGNYVPSRSPGHDSHVNTQRILSVKKNESAGIDWFLPAMKKLLAPLVAHAIVWTAAGFFVDGTPDFPWLVVSVPGSEVDHPGSMWHVLSKLQRDPEHTVLPNIVCRPIRRARGVRAAHLSRLRPRAEEQYETLEVRHPDVVGGSWVLLCDDVLTTGATLRACAGRLMDAGARCVIGVVLGRTVSK